jgi:hypothetical protein
MLYIDEPITHNAIAAAAFRPKSPKSAKDSHAQLVVAADAQQQA